jgi:hypothetical protein
MALKMPYLYCCPVCPRLVNVNSYEEIRVHLSDHEHYRKLKYLLRCQEVKCGADSSKIFNFIRHLKTHKIFSEVSQANEEAREDLMHVDVPFSENPMEVDHPSATKTKKTASKTIITSHSTSLNLWIECRKLLLKTLCRWFLHYEPRKTFHIRFLMI